MPIFVRVALAVALFSTLGLASCTDPPPPVDESLYAPEDAAVRERERMVWQRPGAVIDAMGDVEEKVIADIGAGEGFFARRLAPLADRVIAVEIDQRYLDYLDTLKRFELPQAIQARLEPRLGLPDDPRLAKNEVDIVLIVNTLLEIEEPTAYLRRLYPSLRQQGRLVIVDWKKRRTDIGPPQEKRIALFELEQMLQEAGFHLVSSDDLTLDYQYIVVADKMQ